MPPHGTQAIPKNQNLLPTLMEPKEKPRLRSKGSELALALAPAPRVAPTRLEGAAAAVGDLSAAAAAAAASIARFRLVSRSLPPLLVGKSQVWISSIRFLSRASVSSFDRPGTRGSRCLIRRCRGLGSGDFPLCSVALVLLSEPYLLSLASRLIYPAIAVRI